MQLRVAEVHRRISVQGTMPGWSTRRNRVWETTAWSVFESMVRIWFC